MALANIFVAKDCFMTRPSRQLWDMDTSAMVLLSETLHTSIYVDRYFTGNLHLNIVADAFLPEIQDALEPYIYEVVRK